MSNELTPVTPVTQLPAVVVQEEPGLLARWQQQKTEFFTNINVKDETLTPLVFKVLQKGDRSAKECIGEPIEVTYWYLHEVELTNEATGEVNRTLRLVLVSPDLKTVSTVSEVLVKGWGSAVQLYGHGPYDPPLVAKIKQVPTTANKAYLVLSEVLRKGAPIAPKRAAR